MLYGTASAQPVFIVYVARFAGLGGPSADPQLTLWATICRQLRWLRTGIPTFSEEKGRLSHYRVAFDLLSQRRENNMLFAIVAIFLILWLLGFTLHIAGSLIHLLLVIAVVVLIAGLIRRR